MEHKENMEKKVIKVIKKKERDAAEKKKCNNIWITI